MCPTRWNNFSGPIDLYSRHLRRRFWSREFPRGRLPTSTTQAICNSKILAIVNKTREMTIFQSIVIRRWRIDHEGLSSVTAYVHGVAVFVDHFLWKTVTIGEYTFSIPIRKRSTKQIPRFRSALMKWFRSLGEVRTGSKYNYCKYLEVWLLRRLLYRNCAEDSPV